MSFELSCRTLLHLTAAGFFTALTVPVREADAQEAKPAPLLPTDSSAPPKPALRFKKPFPVGDNVFALTFDDGPVPVAAPRLLAALAKTGMKATFCVLGRNVDAHPELVKQMMAEGHELANHSYSHPKMVKLTDDELREELRKTDAALCKAVGASPKYFRPPNGVVSDAQADRLVKEFGYEILLWSLDSEDWKKPPVGAVTRRITQQIRPGVVVLAHEGFPQSVEEMPDILEKLAKAGFTSVTVSELVARSKKASPGK